MVSDSAFTPNKINFQYMIFSVVVVFSLLYFVLSLPEGIHAALMNSIVSARWGSGILGYGDTTTTTVPVLGCLPLVYFDTAHTYEPSTGLCPDGIANVVIVDSNGDAKAAGDWRYVEVTERDRLTDVITIKNTDPALSACDVYACIGASEYDASQGEIQMSVIGSTWDDPITYLAPNQVYNVTVGFNLERFYGDQFNASYRIRVQGINTTYDESTAGGGTFYNLTQAACNSSNFDLQYSPATWTVSLSDTTSASQIEADLQADVSIINNASKTVTNIRVFAEGNLSNITIVRPQVQGFDLEAGEDLNLTAYLLVNSNTTSQWSYLNISYNCLDGAAASKRIAINYSSSGAVWTDTASTDSFNFSQTVTATTCQNCPKMRFPFTIPESLSPGRIANPKLTLHYPCRGDCQGGFENVYVYFNGVAGGCGPDSTSDLVYSYAGWNPPSCGNVTVNLNESSFRSSSQGSMDPGCNRGWTCTGGGPYNNVVWVDVDQTRRGHYCMASSVTVSFDYIPASATTTSTTTTTTTSTTTSTTTTP